MPTPTVAIVDAYSLLYRAFFALPPMTNKAGEVTNAAYGFTTMLLKLLDERNPEYVVVAFDMPAATFRHEAFEAYKAHRKPMPDALRPQVPMTRDLLDAMQIPMLGVEGFEADDIIGTLARRAEADGFDVLIITGDRDALQLVTEHVHVLANKKGISETIEYDPAAVLARYGVPPTQIPEFKALTGDTSDNIPGVPGIGEKTASKLLQEFGSLDAVLARAGEVKGKTGQALVTYAEQARQSLHLATIHCAVPLEDFTWECCRRQPWDRARVLELFQRFDFRSLLNRLGPPPAPAAEATVAVEALVAPRLLTAPADITAVVTTIRASGACTLLPVSSGDNPLVDPLVGIALSAGSDLHGYIPLLEAPPTQGSLFDDGHESVFEAARLEALRPLLEDPAVAKSGETLKACVLWLRGHGITLRGLAFDVQLAAYLIDPTARRTLADLILDTVSQHVELPDLASLWRAHDRDALAHAASARVQWMQRVEHPLRVGLAQYDVMPLFRDTEMPLIPILAEMEWQGIALDTVQLDTLSAEMEKAIHQLEGEIYRLAGEEFTIHSPKQLQAILFEKLGLKRGRKIKTGYSTDAETLAQLAEEHEIVRKILAYREVTKLKSTYVDALPRLCNPRTGRIHTHFNQAVTVTGRLSSSDPNLQNIPIRTEEGREIRRAFIPGAPGWQLLAADYSQIELRVLAHITRDEALIEVFRRGEDLHTATACRVFGVSPGEVTREMRRMAKVVNFSIPYGTTAFGLAQQLSVPRAMADELMRTYLARFPGVARYMEEVVAQARTDGYVTTLLGRRRPLPDLIAPVPTVRQAAERTAINTPIQGSAADIMKRAMLHLAAALDAHPALSARLLLQVHDEMVLEAPAASIEPLADLLRTAMREAYPLIVPLDVDVKVGPNWRDVSPPVDEVPMTQPEGGG